MGELSIILVYFGLFYFYNSVLLQGSTATANTGPSAAAEGTYYYYFESSSPASTGDIAEFQMNVELTGNNSSPIGETECNYMYTY